MTILKNILLVVVFIITFLIFLPMQNIYFLAEQELKKHDIIISNEKFKKNFIGFTLSDAKVFVKGVDIATLNKVNISLFNASIVSKDIGNSNIKFDIIGLKVIIDFIPTKIFIKKYQMIKKYFKKQKDGSLRYEYELF
jgi:hypothetical protein